MFIDGFGKETATWGGLLTATGEVAPAPLGTHAPGQAGVLHGGVPPLGCLGYRGDGGTNPVLGGLARARGPAASGDVGWHG